MSQDDQNGKTEKAIKIFSAGLSHDLNNIFTALMGYTDLLMDTLSEKPEVMEDLKEIESVILRGNDYIGKLNTIFGAPQGAPPQIAVPAAELIKQLAKQIPSVLKADVSVKETDSTQTVKADNLFIREFLKPVLQVFGPALQKDGQRALVEISWNPQESRIAFCFPQAALSEEEAHLFFTPYHKPSWYTEKTGLTLAMSRVHLLSAGIRTSAVHNHCSADAQTPCAALYLTFTDAALE